MIDTRLMDTEDTIALRAAMLTALSPVCLKVCNSYPVFNLIYISAVLPGISGWRLHAAPCRHIVRQYFPRYANIRLDVVVMPKLDGIETAKQIKAVLPTTAILDGTVIRRQEAVVEDGEKAAMTQKLEY